MTLVGVGHALADAFAFVGEDVPKTLGLHPGTINHVPDYRMKSILATMRHRTLMSGGSSANTIKLAARLGVESHFVGQCGHDQAAQVFESELASAGVKVNLSRSDSPTGMCVTFLCPTQEKTSATFRSASGGLALGLVSDALLRATDVVVIEGYLLDEPAFLDHLMKRCLLAKKPIAFDAGEGALSEGNREALLGHLSKGAIRYLFLHESEAATLTGKSAEGALEVLAAHVSVVVLKRGERGWLVRFEGKLVAIPLAGSVSVDSTGVGDGFQAGFLWALSKGWSPVDACRAGSLVAGCVVGQPGTRIDDFRWERLVADLGELAAQVQRPSN